jgi:SET domain
MGMYVGHASFAEGDVVIDSDLVVPWFDIQWNVGKMGIPSLWREYAWNPIIVQGLEEEVEMVDDVAICSPGAGAVANSKWNMVNLEDVENTPRIGMSGVSSESPGAGAFTPYYGRQFRASSTIVPGMELFVDYGEGYFEYRDAYDTVPREEDYVLADQLLELFRFLQQIVPSLTVSETNISEDLYHLMVHDHPFMSRAMYAMPTNTTTIDHILMTGGTSNATFNETIRTLQWLEENGSCMDNIKDGVSTIPHAGRGAFANRFIPKGGLVAPMPLIHMGDRDVLTMYSPKPQKQGKEHTIRDLDLPTHQQLLLNYCFGHKDTTLLLCPYGSLTASINHSHNQPNARIQWSQHMRHPEWLNQTVLAWQHTMHAGLSFDVVALRDIQEDEEILVDYGLEWETAWQKHVASFDVPRRGYMPAFEMNAQIDLQIKTVFEADYELIDGILTYCRKHMVELARGIDEEEDEDKDEDDTELYFCRVVHRNHNDSYVAEVLSRFTTDHPSRMWEVDVDVVEYVLFDAPRDTFYFRDVPYQRDHHQEWAFRHDMRMPDEVLPNAWRRPAVLQEVGKKPEAAWSTDTQRRVDEAETQNKTERKIVVPVSTSGGVCFGTHQSDHS